MLGIGNKKLLDIMVKVEKDGKYYEQRAHELGQHLEGGAYRYTFDGKEIRFGVPRGYPLYYHANGLRYVGHHYGTNTASDLFGEFVPDDADTGTVICTTNAATKAIKEVVGEQGFPWKWLIVGVVVIVILIIGFQTFKPKANETTTPTVTVEQGK